MLEADLIPCDSVSGPPVVLLFDYSNDYNSATMFAMLLISSLL